MQWMQAPIWFAASARYRTAAIFSL